MASTRALQLSIAFGLVATVYSNCCRQPIPPVPCPCKPTCGGPPCINYDCCPGSDRGKGGCGGGCGRKKRSAETPEVRQLREVATIDFGTFIDKVATVPVQDPNCNSERLRAVLEQSITDNTTLSVERILDRINDGHFIAKCTFNGKPDMERRVSYCQVTKGNTTCALSTGQMLQPPPAAIKLNVSEFFRPDMQSIGDEPANGPTPPPLITIALPDIIPTLASSGPVPPAPFIRKIRGEGFVKH
ncbi:hypothetical protein PRIPAC_81034 [Pristionchus pacificus]|uniref:Uncharacterized protein n=1 Tax=Pristionchus pacificus TaxID=54126 RepID=A0A454XLW1_PRIPA|nr:hypothetical protein PRIPAC_81034 [Pristionchus pacificus]|eukprot:PDM80349.1 hypothetical protein PRIPAC_32928 [Pristionchus pacificus]